MSTRSDIAKLLKCVNEDDQPNINELWTALRDITAVRMNIKNFGYQLARTLNEQLAESTQLPVHPGRVGLESKASTQADIESRWFRYWCHQLHVKPIYHRKLWEFAFLLQALEEHGCLAPGKTGLGFGCGEEPMASYLASRGVRTTVSDLDPAIVAGKGWIETGQHASSLERAYHDNLVERSVFDAHVSHRYIDMNDIPRTSEEYDFCWSICAMEHLGSIESGARFVENSLVNLKSGGVSIHTTEYNYTRNDITIDNWPTVLFQRRHIEELKTRLENDGHRMYGPSFSVGDGVLDKFIDLPPFALGEDGLLEEQWARDNQAGHLKLSIDGFPCTCYGLIIIKK